jgi:hypothetical protein
MELELVVRWHGLLGFCLGDVLRAYKWQDIDRLRLDLSEVGLRHLLQLVDLIDHVRELVIERLFICFLWLFR